MYFRSGMKGRPDYSLIRHTLIHCRQRIVIYFSGQSRCPISVFKINQYSTFMRLMSSMSSVYISILYASMYTDTHWCTPMYITMVRIGAIYTDVRRYM